jgi:outer membrane lipoprotein-sorting protein
MSLKNENYFLTYLITIFFLLFFKSALGVDDKNRVLNYIKSLKNFSASFIQNDGINLSEGKVYIGEKRVRAEYLSPTKILIVLDNNKAMYYNYDLEEDEFFNPKKTNAWFFYDIFRNPYFFEDSSLKEESNELIVEKTGVDIDQRNFVIKVYFEKNPLVLRAVEVLIDNQFLKLSIYDHTYNEEFDKNFFKLINPQFFD